MGRRKMDILKYGFLTFLLPWCKRKSNKRKNQGCIFLATPALFSAKEKELATLKQLFLFNAPKSTSASRQKNEANHRRNIASLVGSICLPFYELSKKHPPQTAKRIWIPIGFRPLVEEREEFFALSREEEKAVWALASSFSLGKEWKI